MNWTFIIVAALFVLHILMLLDRSEIQIETQEFEHYRVRR